MPRKSDGVYTRKDRAGYWIDYKDADGRRRRRKVAGAGTRGQAKLVCAGERVKADKAETLGYTPPSEVSFSQVCAEYLSHQKNRVSAANYERERGIIENHLKPFFSGELAKIRRSAIHALSNQACRRLE